MVAAQRWHTRFLCDDNIELYHVLREVCAAPYQPVLDE